MSKDDSLSEELQNLKNKAKKITGKAREEYLEHVSDLKEKLKQVTGETSEKAKQIIDQTGTYIKENPQKATLISLGVGVGLGLVIGLLLRRK